MEKILFNSNLKTFLIFNISLFFINVGFSKNLFCSPIYKECKSQTFNASKLKFEEPSMYWLNLTNNLGYFSQMAVGYTSEATLGVDRGIDGLNINLKYYLCSTIDDSPYAIQGRPAFVVSDVVPVVFKIATAGEYSIDIYYLTGLFLDQEIFIKDKLTNTIHDLKSGPYLFSSNVGTFNNRFEIVYQNALAFQQTVFVNKSLQVFKQNQDLIIKPGTKAISNVVVYDFNGKPIAFQNVSDTSEIKLFIASTVEFLIVKISTEDGSIVTKKIFNHNPL
ncbi:hypothetical protein [Flavobacterium luteum]|uniref:T9SS sorting signal type C domain-containing protein n=1 Tax=Flavobacterium luteum TaxID=2026654 RepID=A0A7J5A9H3_9FLAO|nr:hypothetical protein [Flavobacterium luteum]KAB1154123.1 hypothetical protein F6464_13555 [Flavobacterium luteum]